MQQESIDSGTLIFVFLDRIGCNKKVWILEPRFLIFFLLHVIGCQQFDALNAMSNGCCVILSPILDIFHKSKEDKNTIYDLHTHKFVLLLPHDFSFFHIPSIASSLSLFSTWFGYLSLKCWKSRTPKNFLQFFFFFFFFFVCLFVFLQFFCFWVVISLSGSQYHGWWNECYELVIQ